MKQKKQNWEQKSLPQLIDDLKNNINNKPVFRN